MTFPWTSPVDLNSFQFNAGSDQELVYYCYDSTGSLLNLNACTLTIDIIPYGGTSVLFSIPATSSGSGNNIMTGFLRPSHTSGSSGKFLHRPMIVTTSGSVYSPSLGMFSVV